jgi:LPS export ABC transporter protein LptC
MMISGPRNILWMIPLLLLVTSFLWQPALVKFLSPHGHVRAQPGIAVQDKSFTLTDVRLARYRNGLPELTLNAARVRGGRQGIDSFMLEKVDAVLFDEGREKARIAGGEGAYEGQGGILTLVDDVSVSVRNQYELRADALRYLIPYKTLKSGTDVFFQSKKFAVRGNGMSYNLDTGAYRVGGRVVCDVKGRK